MTKRNRVRLTRSERLHLIGTCFASVPITIILLLIGYTLPASLIGTIPGVFVALVISIALVVSNRHHREVDAAPAAN
jgi:hypothetical protein